MLPIGSQKYLSQRKMRKKTFFSHLFLFRPHRLHDGLFLRVLLRFLLHRLRRGPLRRGRLRRGLSAEAVSSPVQVLCALHAASHANHAPPDTGRRAPTPLGRVVVAAEDVLVADAAHGAVDAGQQQREAVEKVGNVAVRRTAAQLGLKGGREFAEVVLLVADGPDQVHNAPALVRPKAAQVVGQRARDEACPIAADHHMRVHFDSFAQRVAGRQLLNTIRYFLKRARWSVIRKGWRKCKEVKEKAGRRKEKRKEGGRIVVFCSQTSLILSSMEKPQSEILSSQLLLRNVSIQVAWLCLECQH